MARNIFKNQPQIETLTKNIDLVWYPQAGMRVLSHVEMSVGDVVWDATTGYQRRASLTVSERAANSGGREFYKFKLRVTEDEFDRLGKYLSEHEGNLVYQSCISGVCKALNRAEITYIPPPFSKLGTWNAAYWRIQKLLGNRRIESVVFVGKNQLKTLITPELVTEGLAGAFLVYGGYEGGKKLVSLIPVEKKSQKTSDKHDQNGN